MRQFIIETGEDRLGVDILIIAIDKVMIAERADAGVCAVIMSVLVVVGGVMFVVGAEHPLQVAAKRRSSDAQFLGDRLNLGMDGQQEIVERGSVCIIR